MMRPIKTVPCKYCQRRTTMLNTKLCDSCWEVATRLESFLRLGKARALAFVIETLHEIFEEAKA